MSRAILGAVLLSFLTFSGTAQAREELKNYLIQEAYDTLNIAAQLEGVKMYFQGALQPQVHQSKGIFRTNRKTNAFNKTDIQACQWVFFSALTSLRDRALAEGGNAVINIKSNYKNREYSSPTNFQCGVGNIIAGVALIGEVVKIGGGGGTSTSNKSSSGTSGSVDHGSSSTTNNDCSVKKILDMKNIGMTNDQIEAACSQ